MKRAFTLIELVFIIILIGIVSVISLNVFKTDTELQEMEDQLIRHIRYAQHLALMDDRFTPKDIVEDNANYWFRTMWRISFIDNNQYVISSNVNLNGIIEDEEIAEDTHLKTKIRQTFKNVTFELSNSDCTSIYFDTLGRPVCSPDEFERHLGINALDSYYSNLLENNLTITLRKGTQESRITVIPYTGYVAVP